MIRKIHTANETKKEVQKSSNGKIEVYSFFPIDKAYCSCVADIFRWKKKFGEATIKQKQELLAQTPFLECLRSKVGMTRYEIICNNCNETQGYCWATDESLIDWWDFHYVQWTDGDYWQGCFTPNISPIDQKLCLECTCGSDTRDFRANSKMSQKEIDEIEAKNGKERDFGKPDSAFKVKEVKGDVIK